MSRIPNFANAPFEAAPRLHKPDEARLWRTPEGIDVKSSYGPGRSQGLDFLDDWPGLPPYLRGPYPTMYVNRPWTVRQYAGLLDCRGVQRLLPAQPRRRPERPVGRLRSGDHRGYDSDHPRVPGDVGMAGVAIDSHPRHAHAVLRHPARSDERVDDHERRGVAGSGALHRRRRGTGRRRRRSCRARSRTTSSRSSWSATPTSIRPAPSMRIISDIFAYTAAKMPKFNSISISGYHMQEAGRDAGSRTRLHAGRRRRICARRHCGRHERRRSSRRGCRSSGRSA